MTTETAPVALFIQDLQGGGAEKVTVQLANVLARRGYRVDLICQSFEGAYVKDVSSEVRSVAIGSRAPHKTIFFLYKYLKREKPRVLFTMLEKPSLLGISAAFLARYRKVIPGVHNDLEAYALLDHQMRRKFLKLLVAVFYRYAFKVTAVSAGAGAVMNRMLGSGVPVEIVYNGFDLEGLRKQSREIVSLPFPENKEIPVFIACGRMAPQKGFDLLLRAFAKLRKDMPARLIILGEGPLKDDLAALAQELNISHDVYFPGFVPTPAAWFARSNVFVLSSRAEGFGNVIVEALASGTQVVSMDCPSGPAEILQFGKYGRLASSGDVEALAAAMKAALTSPPDRATQASVQAYLDKTFSVESMVDGYVRAMESLA